MSNGTSVPFDLGPIGIILVCFLLYSSHLVKQGTVSASLYPLGLAQAQGSQGQGMGQWQGKARSQERGPVLPIEDTKP